MLGSDDIEYPQRRRTMTKMIAICEFEKMEKPYEYLCDIPEGAVLEDLKYAVTLSDACADDASILKTKRLLTRLQVVYVRSFKPITEQVYSGELNRVVLVFGMSDFVEHAIRKQQIRTLKANLETRIAEMSVFDKIRSLNITDENILSMAMQLKALLEKK